MSFRETPVWDELCRVWQVVPESGVAGLNLVIEGKYQVAVPGRELVAGDAPKVIEGEVVPVVRRRSAKKVTG